jgi:glycosyltransferase involved in cell wall biosynthesis
MPFNGVYMIKKKVCHIISGDLWAGAEVMAFQLIKELKRNWRFEVLAILFNYGRLSDELKKLGIDVYVIDEKKHSFAGLMIRTGLILGKNCPDVIHSHRYKENIIAYLLSYFIPGTRLISTQHGMPERPASDDRLGRRIILRMNNYFLNRKYNHFICVSCDLKNRFLKDFGFCGRNISVIHNGIETVFKQKKNNHHVMVVGSAGRLFPVKDYSLFVEIAGYVRLKNKSIVFKLAGDGPERNMLANRVDELELSDGFEFKGHVDNMDCFYRSLDVYLNTSISEGIPMSILEAMTRGIPVIAPNVGGIAEIVSDSDDGYLINDRNPRNYGDKIIELYVNKDKYQVMSDNAEKKIHLHFSVKKMSESYEKIYS